MEYLYEHLSMTDKSLVDREAVADGLEQLGEFVGRQAYDMLGLQPHFARLLSSAGRAMPVRERNSCVLLPCLTAAHPLRLQAHS